MAKEATILTFDDDIKAKAQELFADFGFDLSTAVNIFLRQSVHEDCIPFNIRREAPNADTIAAIKEAEKMVKYTEKYKSYTDADEMMKELLS
ncbi:MAG: type II toxin-antitoxin system RelB/DinJ family antitoxin [Firmicutes bacterium]|nr:type II toxin-antitoxin system RelB/DinJ family antitoxin [Bacillota bacterium]